MKKFYSILLGLLLTASILKAQEKSPYMIYNAKGKKVSYKKMLKTLEKADIILFGEEHNSAIAHWLQYEVCKDLGKSRELILGAEMFEADNQESLDDFLSGQIDQKGLDTLARLWNNYKTDYAPLVNFAKDNNLPFIATNVPRKFASKVYKEGGFEALESLSEHEKSWIAPLPVAFDANLPGYQNMLRMMGDHGSVDMVKAQAIKDATMAYFISKNYQQGKLFIHYNGAYHSNNYEGILWYLKNDDSSRVYRTISTVTQQDVYELKEEHKQLADFIICVDEDMTKTY
ncbi:ChaN family lipoprotein [Echinicola sp. CAU 1574]|uniref:ChaN family lipoprotein n=1 Tax=Echinicola arenosa TaxID=2774144 RepID=A0ABR9AJK8_9BACT|nr:ChaN family lipoprotein [Echinicola arenosa]MBD8488941.1 ChaN family lipoprotein [Echinicola arenosa]